MPPTVNNIGQTESSNALLNNSIAIEQPSELPPVAMQPESSNTLPESEANTELLSRDQIANRIDELLTSENLAGLMHKLAISFNRLLQKYVC